MTPQKVVVGEDDRRSARWKCCARGDADADAIAHRGAIIAGSRF
jgi:hypothetical protein